MKKIDNVIQETANRLGLSYENTYDLAITYLKVLRQKLESNQPKIAIPDVCVIKIEPLFVNRRLLKVFVGMRKTKARNEIKAYEKYKSEFRELLSIRTSLIKSGEWKKQMKKVKVRKAMLEDYQKFLKDGPTNSKNILIY